MSKNQIRPRLALLAAAASVATVAVLIVMKAAVWVTSGSTSVLASLMDSGVDASVSLMTFMAIRYSLKPADEEHRHGHGKIEGLAALTQAAVIGGAGVFLLMESVSHITDPHPHIVTGHLQTIIVMVVSTLLSFVLIAVQNYSLNHAPSLAVEADRAHYATDVFVNIGVIAVTAALYFGAPRWIDPAFALLVVVYLGFAVRQIGGKGIDMLLDRELPQETRDIILSLVRSQEGVRGIHDLRTGKSGMKVRMSFDIEVDPDLSLRAAHDIARRAEHELLRAFPHADIMIHVDPHGDTDDSRHHVPGVHDR